MSVRGEAHDYKLLSRATPTHATSIAYTDVTGYVCSREPFFLLIKMLSLFAHTLMLSTELALWR